MKKLSFFFVAAVLGSVLSATAQQVPDLRTQAVENTRKLAQQIALDDARTTQVKRATYERLVQENDLKQMYSIDPAMLQSKMAVVDKEYAEKLKGMLTEAQYQRYVALTTVSAPVPVPATTAVAVAPPATPVAAVAARPVSAPKAPAKKVVVPKPKTVSGTPAKKALPKAHASTAVGSRS
ncbi:hypothetical protein LGH70_00465 [Hymenobacter sp. BT635]|uniref:DUF4168 domain-containing protein n=1 Tax=Hymenobacter nitidus TaxID=2880929 RepID=A0ABS8A6K8_9BACT|nr:hypothetical protein [Hymenobacter nitidus]MCB2376035.1 hypothetical protein [Hymenobacter nitidus]